MAERTVGILTVSDTAHADPGADLTGPALATLPSPLARLPFRILRTHIVPDDPRVIADTVRAWVDDECLALILTVGGTGCAPRDTTPEAIAPLLQRPLPGLVHTMLASSLAVTPFAALARLVAGIRASSLIVTLPGSPKAATENLAALEPILEHALELIGGGRGECIHAALGAPTASQRSQAAAASSHSNRPGRAPHHHNHHDHDHHGHAHTHWSGHTVPAPLTAQHDRSFQSHDPGQPVSSRHRVSPYPIISMAEAFKHIFAHTNLLGTEARPVDSSLVGRVLAEDISASFDIPRGLSTNVDGYAAVAPLPCGTYSVLASSLAFNSGDKLPSNTLCRVNTGGPLPPGANAVIMVEDTKLVSASEDGEEVGVKTLTALCEDENVRRPGSDVRAGDIVLERGQSVTTVGGEVGTLAFVGRRLAQTHILPTVAVLSTGNELVDLNAAPDQKSAGWNGVFDTNRPALLTALAARHFPVIDGGIVPDSASETADAIRAACLSADVVVTTGGTSMGEADFLKPVLERHLDGTIHFARVAMKPGKPTIFASVPSPKGSPVLVFALPGNPASCLVTLHVFVLPALRKMAGMPYEQWHLPTVPVQINFSAELDPRPQFHRVLVKPSNSKCGGQVATLVAESTGGQRSSCTVSLAAANALLKLPSSLSEDSKTMISKGEIVNAVLIGDVIS